MKYWFCTTFLSIYLSICTQPSVKGISSLTSITRGVPYRLEDNVEGSQVVIFGLLVSVHFCQILYCAVGWFQYLQNRVRIQICSGLYQNQLYKVLFIHNSKVPWTTRYIFVNSRGARCLSQAGFHWAQQ